MTWFSKACAWIKKYWKYILFPVGIVLGILSVIGRRRQTVVAPEVLGAEEERKRADEEAQRRLVEAEEVRASELARIEEKHQATIDRLTEEQRSRLDELRQDPDELNSFLVGVGREVRDGSE